MTDKKDYTDFDCTAQQNAFLSALISCASGSSVDKMFWTVVGNGPCMNIISLNNECITGSADRDEVWKNKGQGHIKFQNQSKVQGNTVCLVSRKRKKKNLIFKDSFINELYVSSEAVNGYEVSLLFHTIRSLGVFLNLPLSPVDWVNIDAL